MCKILDWKGVGSDLCNSRNSVMYLHAGLYDMVDCSNTTGLSDLQKL